MQTTLKTTLLVAALLGSSLAFSASMSKADHSAAKDRISAEYKAAKKACDSNAGNAKDICVEQAKGVEKVALADLQFQFSGKSADATKLAIAKSDATYAVAKEMCDDKAGNDKDVCVKEAKAAHVKGVTDAKLTKEIHAAVVDANDTKRDADYKVAAEKCDALAGDAKTGCINSAKATFGKK